jgi:DNA-binding response OmpR family regulator
MVFGFGKRKKPLILHVDDEPDIVGFVKAGLMAVGADVVSADNGADGFNLAKSKRPDLILLDIRMPLTDGFEVCHQLKTDDATKSIPVIMVTALGQMRDVEKALGMGAAGYLVKPFDMPKLFAKVSEFVALPQIPPPTKP